MSDILLKVLIVDDEHLVRNLLRNCINWEEIGYEIVGEASNAHEALDLVEQLRPDVIFTDIYMPFMDGLEFGKLVFEKYTNIKIIVLTGYEEFEYAKKSVKIGIADFLLKPINDDEIRKSALNMKAKIEAERNHKAEYDRIKKQLEESLPYLKEKVLINLLQSNAQIKDISQQLDYFQIQLNPSHIQVAVIEPSLPESETESGEEDRLLLNMQSSEMAAKYFRDDALVHVFLDNSQNIVIINSNEAMDFNECLEALRTILLNKLKCHVCIGLGNRYSQLSRISASYREARQALNYKVIAGKNQVLSYSDLNFAGSASYGIRNDSPEDLSFYIKAGMKKNVSEYIERVFTECGISNSRINVNSIRVTASGIISVLLSVITEMEITIEDIFSGISQPFSQVFKIDNLPEMKRYILALTEATLDTIQNMRNKKVNQAIEQVKEYLNQNLADPDISLANTARSFYMNMSYLSRIFKQETGSTFVEYLTKIRMEKAIRLLKETDLKAYQIAEEVGIVNPHYFGICFKKWTGVSINDFKKS